MLLSVQYSENVLKNTFTYVASTFDFDTFLDYSLIILTAYNLTKVFITYFKGQLIQKKLIRFLYSLQLRHGVLFQY